MLVHIYIEIKGKINSRELYTRIEQKGINVTDIGDCVLVYGDCGIEQVSHIVYSCALYGNIKVDITH